MLGKRCFLSLLTFCVEIFRFCGFATAVLQAEVTPCLLIQGRHKFHLRSYLAVVEKLWHPDVIDVFVFNRHEVRLANSPVKDDPNDRDRGAHITNGSNSESSRRELLSDVPELVELGMQDKVETFLSQVFGNHLLPDMKGRVTYSANQDNGASGSVRKFAVAAVDMMVASDGHIYLLEVNVNPAAPPETMVDGAFKEHLTGFMKDLIQLIFGRPPSSFLLTRDVLEQKGLLPDAN